MSLNKVMLIGNVGKDPEVRYLEQNPQTPGNAPKVASFTLATTERFRDRNGELRENTEWHNVVAWRNNADVCEKFVRKGTQLYVEGRLRSRSWDGNDGAKHYITEVLADTIQLLGRRQDNPASQGGYNGQGAYGAQGQNYGAQGGYNQQGSYNTPAGFAPQGNPSARPAGVAGATPASAVTGAAVTTPTAAPATGAGVSPSAPVTSTPVPANQYDPQEDDLPF